MDQDRRTSLSVPCHGLLRHLMLVSSWNIHCVKCFVTGSQQASYQTLTGSVSLEPFKWLTEPVQCHSNAQHSTLYLGTFLGNFTQTGFVDCYVFLTKISAWIKVGAQGGIRWKVVILLAFMSPTESLPLLCLCFVQLDNPDEQAAQIRRELDGRLQMADQIARVRDFTGSSLVPGQGPTQEVYWLVRSSKDEGEGPGTEPGLVCLEF